MSSDVWPFPVATVLISGALPSLLSAVCISMFTTTCGEFHKLLLVVTVRVVTPMSHCNTVIIHTVNMILQLYHRFYTHLSSVWYV